MIKIEGGCLCGAVRYVASAEPIVSRVCWCRVCQYLASGNATVNLVFPAEAITITGELRDYPSIADSGRHMHRRFCPNCGVHVLSGSEERSDLVVVRVGTLDTPENVALDSHIWTSSAPHWALLDPDLPQFETQPPPLVKKDAGN
ncbi:MAG: GFA family protein [Gammaproteobacteria bacterium]|nr:GFA family protein [Gammaproteobacteria bacterium]